VPDGLYEADKGDGDCGGCCGDYEGRPHELDVGRSEVFEVSRDIGGYYGAQAEAEKDYAVIEGDIFGPEVVGGYGGVVA